MWREGILFKYVREKNQRFGALIGCKALVERGFLFLWCGFFFYFWEVKWGTVTVVLELGGGYKG